MDGSDRKSVSSSSSKPLIKPFSACKPSASDENNQSCHKMGLNSPQPAAKHFMSPTISAASKVIAPRKKILAERNQNSDIRMQRTPHMDPKGTFSSLDMENSDDSLSVNSDSSLRSYDPLTNCLSPRPKFLRYKPNRGREIILEYENEVKGKKERLSSGEVVPLDSEKGIDEDSDMVSASQEGFVNQEGEEVDEREEGVEEDEEEEGEVDEEREGFWRSVLRFLLVLVVLVLSTLYISSSNSPTTSPTLQAMEGLKDGYLKIHDRFLNTMSFKEIMKFLEGGNEYLDGSIGLMKINQTVVYEGIGEEEMVEDVYIGKVEELCDNLLVVEALGGGSEVEVADEKGNEEEKMVEDFYMGNLSGVVEPLGGESEVAVEDEKKIGAGDLGEIVELELLQDNQIPIVTNALQTENEVVMEPVQENNLGPEDLRMVDSEMEKTENFADMAGDVFMLEGMDNEITNFEILNSEAEDNLKEELIENMESEITFKAVVGVSLSFVIVASLVLAFHFKRKRNDKKDSSIAMKPFSKESGVKEKCSPIVLNEREDNTNHVDSFASPMSSINSSLMDSKELSQTLAPSVELLGEFVVGEMSSSFRSNGMKIESEVSSHSISMDNMGFQRKTHSVPIHAQQDFSEVSAMHSKSYGYSTPVKKVSKKEEGVDGDAKNVATTPLRRSSRLRNRAVTSPR